MGLRVVANTADGLFGAEATAAPAGAAADAAPDLVRFHGPGLPCSLALDRSRRVRRDPTPRRSFWFPALRA